MEKSRITPRQIPFLVRLTANLFREIREETKSPNDNPINLRDESTQMHFVADLLKDLVDTAYPINERGEKSPRPYQINIPVIEDAELMADVIIEAIKMAEEDCVKDGEI